MEKLKLQLKTITKSLAALSKQVEKITKQAGKLQPVKTTVAKKAVAKKKAPAKKAVAKKKAPTKKAVAKKKAPTKKAVAKKKAPTKKAVAKKKAPAKKAVVAKKKASAQKGTVIDSVLGIIKRSKKGVSVANLRARTGLDAKQLSNTLYKLSKRGKIKAQERGLYISK